MSHLVTPLIQCPIENFRPSDGPTNYTKTNKKKGVVGNFCVAAPSQILARSFPQLIFKMNNKSSSVSALKKEKAAKYKNKLFTNKLTKGILNFCHICQMQTVFLTQTHAVYAYCMRASKRYTHTVYKWCTWTFSTSKHYSDVTGRKCCRRVQQQFYFSPHFMYHEAACQQ